MSTTLERLHTLVDQLSPDKQEQLLDFIEGLTGSEGTQESQLPPGKPASELLSYRFSLSKEDIDAMERAIMEDCERIDPDETY